MHSKTANPLQLAERDELDELAARSLHLANVVQATSRRRDVRQRRTRILLLLLAMSCPLGRRPARAWYVPGAAARLGHDGIRRAWLGYFGEEPPSERSIRSHLGVLEHALAIVRQPGDLLPVLGEPGEHRPRYPDTFHLLTDERLALWWSTEGAPLLEQHPQARQSAATWRRLFGDWRTRAAAPQGVLPFDLEADDPTRDTRRDSEARRLSDAAELETAAATGEVLAVLSACARIGAPIRGSNSFRLASDGPALCRAARRLAADLRRGRRIRNRAGWLVWAFTRARGSPL